MQMLGDTTHCMIVYMRLPIAVMRVCILLLRIFTERYKKRYPCVKCIISG
jgi:hypothetical protein